jgi:hypothetical protein
MPERTPKEPRAARLVLSDVRPQVDCARYAVKRVTGETVDVSAVAITDGHDLVRAELGYRAAGTRRWTRVPMLPTVDDSDRFAASFLVEEPGVWEFTVSAWIDRAATWRDELRRRVEAGQTDLAAELAEGAELLATDIPDAETALATTGSVIESKVSLTRPLTVVVERPIAAFGAWYELFPRSFGGFKGVERALPEIADLGFDVVYLPPIHPIGTTNRKGANNTLAAAAGDPGSPWAIGGPEGGHKAVHPELGTLADFDRLVLHARELGREVGLARADLAAQLVAPGRGAVDPRRHGELPHPGFSACLIVPSGRRLNHSGCSVSQGWSGEHCTARSIATSSPSFRARATSRSKSASVPSSGCTASCPPSAAPIAHGLPGAPRSAGSVLFAPFRPVRPMGWIGGK